MQPLRITGEKVEFEHGFDRIDDGQKHAWSRWFSIPGDDSRKIIVLDRRSVPDASAQAIRRGVGHVIPILIRLGGDPAGSVRDGVGEIADSAELSLSQLAQRIAPPDSPLWLPVCDLISAEQGRQLILDESFEPYFSALHPLEIAALTGNTVTGDLEDCRNEARRRFSDAVMEFTPDEAEALRHFVDMYHRGCHGSGYPRLLGRTPWRFLKVRGDLCGGFPHTRATYIVTSERFLSKVLADRHTGVMHSARGVGQTLVHEKIHVLQRLLPDRFDHLAGSVMGFRRARIATNEWLNERQISNPDALDVGWLLPVTSADGSERMVWPRTLLKSDRAVPRMGDDFWPVAVDVKRDGDTWRVVEVDGQPRLHPLDEFREVLETMQAPRGIDHPNEVAAYVFPKLWIEWCASFANSPRDPKLERYGEWFNKYFD